MFHVKHYKGGKNIEGRCIIIIYYRDSDSIINVLSGQEIQRLNVESEKKQQQREYEAYTLMRSILNRMLIRNSLSALGFEWSYLFYKEFMHYKAPERILRPTKLIISDSSHTRIKLRISRIQCNEIISIYKGSENQIKKTLNKLYGRENIYDS